MSDEKKKPTVEDAENNIIAYIKSHGPQPIHDICYLAVFPPDASISWEEEDQLMTEAIHNLITDGRLVKANLGDKRGLQWAGKEKGDK